MPSFRRITSRMAPAALLVAVVTLAACDGLSDRLGPEADVPDDVAAFVMSQGLPDVHEIRSLLAAPEEGIVFFWASYGPPQDCFSGCFFFRGWGLKLADRIGWIEVDGAHSLPGSSQLTYFDIHAGDAPLFSEDLQTRLQVPDERYFRPHINTGFRILLVIDPDTPGSALLMLARRLPRDGWPYLGYLLVEAARARSDRGLLQVLADLPDGSWDYSDVRARARAALTQLGG